VISIGAETDVLQRLNAPGLAKPPGYAHVVVTSGTRVMMTAGAVPLDAEGNLVGAGDVRAQTRQVLDNLMWQLAAAEATGEDVLKTTVYVASTDRADLAACWEEVQQSPIAAAASTLLGVALLGYAGQLVEIEAFAVLP
jgi:enamine deaminase RidA (YjgF/YER057c/UK114 family)